MNVGTDTRTPFAVLKRVLRLARKELREILRDRRTIVTLIAMPLLIYPLMSVVFLQFSWMNQAEAGSGPQYDFATLSSAEELAFQRRLKQGQDAVRRAHAKFAGESQPVEKLSPPPEFVPFLEKNRPKDEHERAEQLERFKEALRDKKIHLIVMIPKADADELLEDPPTVDRALSCEIISAANSAPAQAALAYIEAMFAAANEENLKARLGLPDIKTRITMLNVERVALTVPAEDPLAALVPLILILMTITGAVYPAIDLTAGERERGTLEILVAAPVARFELLSAKYISVMTVAMLTALVNLICMTATVTWSGLFPADVLSPLVLVQVLGLLLLFAAFFSAVLLCLTSFARSFKEAQAYLIPLMLASLTPGVVALMPGIKLGGVLAALPLVNVVLMARDLFEEGVEPVVAAVVILTTLLYALAALALAARVFGAESVLYSEQSSWADLLSRPRDTQPTATLPAILWCLALMVPVHFGLIALVRALQPAPVAGIVLIVGVNILLFGALPALFAYLGRVDLRAGLGLRLPHPMALVAGGLLGMSLWPIQLWLLAQSDLPRMLEERFGSVLESFQRARASIGWGVLAVVIVPAILEEVFFRGLLFNALRRQAGAWLTIGASGLLFGATHVVLDSALGLERLIPTTLLGLILGALCWRSGSLWPCLILHVLHNTILLVVGINDPGSTKEVPWQWLAGGAVGVIVGALLVWRYPGEILGNHAGRRVE